MPVLERPQQDVLTRFILTAGHSICYFKPRSQFAWRTVPCDTTIIARNVCRTKSERGLPMKKITRIGIGWPVGSGKTALVESIAPVLIGMGVKVLVF